jgi:hypothetical protein
MVIVTPNDLLKHQLLADDNDEESHYNTQHKPRLFNTQRPPFFHKTVQKPSAGRAREPRKLLFN